MGAVVEIWFESLIPFLLKDCHIVQWLHGSSCNGVKRARSFWEPALAGFEDTRLWLRFVGYFSHFWLFLRGSRIILVCICIILMISIEIGIKIADGSDANFRIQISLLKLLHIDRVVCYSVVVIFLK